MDTPGRAPIAPKILMGLWLLATLDGVGSAREVDRRRQTDVAHQWMCGGVSVNCHTLSDFRMGHAQALDALLTRQVAALLSAGLVESKQTGGKEACDPRWRDAAAVFAWRERMAPQTGKTIYKERAKAECVNARARRCALTPFAVRGLHKIRAVVLWFALAHNLGRAYRLGTSTA